MKRSPPYPPPPHRRSEEIEKLFHNTVKVIAVILSQVPLTTVCQNITFIINSSVKNLWKATKAEKSFSGKKKLIHLPPPLVLCIWGNAEL
jgi:hypothetical protein